MNRKPPASRKTQPRGDEKDMGNALRSVYDETVNEEIPPEMLDLLSKLQ